jgi:16S rRNA (uracil1498-N3)-methyltransferase
MPRFHCPLPLAVGDLLALPDHVAHHIQVIRLQAGAMVTLFNGDGNEYYATITLLEKKRVTVEVKTCTARSVELPYAITLAQALPESSKMDWIIEKAVELGVAGVQPLSAQRCVVRLSAERAEKRQSHWQGIIVSASEQSGRNRLAQLAPVTDFSRWIARHDIHKRILLSPRADQSLADWARHQPPQAVTLLIGPEGGLSDDEENLAIAHGAIALSMGPRVLRTETAGLAALAMLAGAWGDSTA